MNTKEYINQKIKELGKKYDVLNKLNRYEDTLKRQWKQEYNQRENIWRTVNSLSDIEKYVDCFVYSVKREKNLKTRDLDTYDSDVALYRAIYAFEKAACCYDNSNCNFTNLNTNTIDYLFDRLYMATKELQETITYRSMQD